MKWIFWVTLLYKLWVRLRLGFFFFSIYLSNVHLKLNKWNRKLRSWWFSDKLLTLNSSTSTFPAKKAQRVKRKDGGGGLENADREEDTARHRDRDGGRRDERRRSRRAVRQQQAEGSSVWREASTSELRLGRKARTAMWRTF